MIIDLLLLGILIDQSKLIYTYIQILVKLKKNLYAKRSTNY
jgi:hypothetical protein